MTLDLDDPDARLALVSDECRSDLLTAILVLLERFNAEHDLGLDLPGRVMLLGEVMTDFTERVAESVAPVH